MEELFHVKQRFFMCIKADKETLESLQRRYKDSFLIINDIKEECSKRNRLGFSFTEQSISLSIFFKAMQAVLCWIESSIRNIVIFCGISEEQKTMCSVCLFYCGVSKTSNEALELIENALKTEKRLKNKESQINRNPNLQRYAGYVEHLVSKEGAIERKNVIISRISVYGESKCDEIEVSSSNQMKEKHSFSLEGKKECTEERKCVFVIKRKHSGDVEIVLDCSTGKAVYQLNTDFCAVDLLKVSGEEIHMNKKNHRLKILLCEIKGAFQPFYPYASLFNEKKEVPRTLETQFDSLSLKNSKAVERRPPPPPGPMKKKSVWLRRRLEFTELEKKKEECIWDEIETEKGTCFDLERFEKLFCVSEKEKEKKQKKIVSDCYEVQKLNNISISLSRFRKRYKNMAEVFDAVKKQDEHLNEEDLLCLLDVVQVAKKIKRKEPSLCYDSKSLDAISFLDETRTEDRIGVFCELFYAQKVFVSETDNLLKEMTAIFFGLQKVICCSELKRLLRVLIDLMTICRYKYGRSENNRVVYGFRLKDLFQIKEIKSIDGCFSLLDYVSSSFCFKFDELLNDMFFLKKIESDKFDERFTRLEWFFMKNKMWIDKSNSSVDVFTAKTQAFIEDATKKFEMLEEWNKRTKDLWCFTKKYFRQEETLETPKFLFKTIHDFLFDLVSAAEK